jgi:DNA-binding CsgD family transcriptional regulator/tetratricopeptide (TPR) repeat protein
VQELLEREGLLATLHAALPQGGRLVFAGGEAGVGKTSFARRFVEEQPDSVRVLWGECDALFAPRPLGPFLDLARSTGGELQELVESGARPHEIATALVQELETRSPTVLVVEDVHWADEATLDVLRLLGRRVRVVPALVLVTYRNDELDPVHPLRVVLGELVTSDAVERITIEPLSQEAVTELAEPHRVDAEELYRRTGGNAFFVTEALAAGEEELPETIRDAVLARAARLSPTARALVEAAAVVSPHVELWLLEALAGDAFEHIDECLASGMLRVYEGDVAFRNELARLTIEEGLAPNRRLALHRSALAALASPPAGVPDLARLAHHAEAAGDTGAVLEFAPRAAERAAHLGAHREAAAQYARALRFAQELELEARAELLDRYSYEAYLTGQLSEAIEAQEHALEGHRTAGDWRKEGDALRSLSRLLRYVGRTEEAVEAGHDAVAVLEAHPPGHELAMAYCHVSHQYVWAEEADGALAWSTRSLELAQRLDDTEALVYGLINIGAAEMLAGSAEGTARFEQSVELAQEAGLEEHAGRAFVNLVWWAPRDRSYAVADRHLEAGLEYCAERGLDLWRLYLLAYRARSELDRGCWDEAVESASFVVRDPRASPVPRIWALAVIGLVRARRGDPDHWAPLDEAWALAEPTAEMQRVEPAAAARAEAAWLEGRTETVAAATDAPLELARRRGATWAVEELTSWRRRAGIRDELPNGRPRRTAAKWRELGCPYDAALALADTGQEGALRRSHEELLALGALPAAGIVARRLRERGATGIARGPRSETRSHPAGLTRRELDVLDLLGEGMTNAEIAARLVISEKTVGHHVSSILGKLGVRSRYDAAKLAAQDREGAPPR